MVDAVAAIGDSLEGHRARSLRVSAAVVAVGVVRRRLVGTLSPSTAW
jgi:hypothetical protein